jgi:predicted protein tyrosine phosphatase
MFSEKYPQHEFLSAGTNIDACRRHGTQELTEDLLDWADTVYVMENKHQKQIKNHQQGKKYGHKIKILGIKDYYEYNDPTLRELLREKVYIQQ